MGAVSFTLWAFITRERAHGTQGIGGPKPGLGIFTIGKPTADQGTYHYLHWRARAGQITLVKEKNLIPDHKAQSLYLLTELS